MAHVFSEDVLETFYSDQHLGYESHAFFGKNKKLRSIEEACVRFIKEYRLENTFVYREVVKANYRSNKYELSIDFSDLIAFNKELSDRIASNPNSIIPIMESAALDVVAETIIPAPNKADMHPIQIKFHNYQRKESIRELRSSHILKLISVTGIITSTYRVQNKATKIKIKCQFCNDTRTLNSARGFGMVSVPRVCTSKAQGISGSSCELDPFIVLPDACSFVDIQKLRLQELPEDVPTGEIPCHVTLSVERTLVDTITAGTRVNAIGVYSIYQAKPKYETKGDKYSNVRIPYIHVLGLEPISDSHTLRNSPFTVTDEELIRSLSRDPKIYEKLAQSLAPKIYGHEDIKKSIVCLLFGGTRKILPSRFRIRGDINILLLGDPSVAKSQLLKCTEKTAPISVYTSGKGSSAAGLTASVIQDASGDYHLEGGAMVLADGGCVCIDEFDKMRENDRVAIHEAMEQQTISIAKAGITTVLNSRTSVLAAANPTFGRYDDMKKAAENIDFETTILSRFDMIFIIRDKRDEKKDEMLSSHVLNIHMQKEVDENKPEIDPALMTKYISYCRKNCHPQLSEDAAELLKNRYVAFRIEAKKKQDEQGVGTIPITVRQLEAIVRIAEARAKLQLSEIATVDHVKEAIRLFKVATMAAANTEGEVDFFSVDESESKFVKDVQRAERHLRRRLPIGTKWSFSRIVKELVIRNHSESAVRRAVHTMRSRGELESSAQGKMIMRKR